MTSWCCVSWMPLQRWQFLQGASDYETRNGEEPTANGGPVPRWVAAGAAVVSGQERESAPKGKKALTEPGDRKGRPLAALLGAESLWRPPARALYAPLYWALPQARMG